MSVCEKCWSDSRTTNDYFRLLKERESSPCSPEEQAGPDAGECKGCGRKTVHQHTGQLMCGCTPMCEAARSTVGDGTTTTYNQPYG